MSSKATKQFVRYSLVGLLSNVMGYLLYLLVTTLGVGPKTTMSFFYFIGAMVGYIGNRQWAFAHKGSVVGSLYRYCLVHIFGYGLNFLILGVFVDIYGYPHQLIQAFAIVIVAVFLFISFRLFVFSKAAINSRGSS